MRLIVLNGPPRSGKDTLAAMLPGLKRKFSAPLKRAVPAIYGVADLIPDADLEKVKETQFDFLFGQSYRQAQIAVFQWLERVHGPAVLGEIEARVLQANARHIMEKFSGLVVYSDGGRGAEISALAASVGFDNMLIIQLVRDGTDYSNDIRSYVDIPEIKTIRLHNNGTPDDLIKAAVRAIQEAKPGWL